MATWIFPLVAAIALRKMRVARVSDLRRAAFELRPARPDAGHQGAAAFEHGLHREYVFAADSHAELKEWLLAIDAAGGGLGAAGASGGAAGASCDVDIAAAARRLLY